MDVYQLTAGAMKLMQLGLQLGWPILAVLAWGLWVRGRHPATAAFAAGLTVQAVSHLGLLPRLASVRIVVFPLYLWGLALAVLWWSGESLRTRRTLLRALLAMAALVTITYSTFPLTVRYTGSGHYVVIGGLMTVAGLLFWIILALSAWAGREQGEARPLQWLTYLAALAGFSVVVEAMAPQGFPIGLAANLLSLAILAMAAGVVATTWRVGPRHLA